MKKFVFETIVKPQDLLTEELRQIKGGRLVNAGDIKCKKPGIIKCKVGDVQRAELSVW
ncbi:MAG: hypothetical protein SVU94_05765 [Bacteroidota bacterium]|nr:hypothetical protein [Bacteroidota bacterium]